MNLLCIYCSVQIQNMLMNFNWICPMIIFILALICCEDCCDGQGQLHHICCAEFHMGMVVQIPPCTGYQHTPTWFGGWKVGSAWGRTWNLIVGLVTSFWHETLKIMNDLPTGIFSQVSTQHQRQKLSQRLCAQRSDCRRVWWGRTEYSLGVDTAFWSSEYIWHFLCL